MVQHTYDNMTRAHTWKSHPLPHFHCLPGVLHSFELDEKKEQGARNRQPEQSNQSTEDPSMGGEYNNNLK